MYESSMYTKDTRPPDTSYEPSADRLEGHFLAAVVTTAESAYQFPEVGVTLARTPQLFGEASNFMPQFECNPQSGGGGGGGGGGMGSSSQAATGAAVASVGQPWPDLSDLVKAESGESYAQLSPVGTQAAGSSSTVDLAPLRPPSSVSPHYDLTSPSLSCSSTASTPQTTAEYPTGGESSGRTSRASAGGGKSRSARKRLLEKGTPEYVEKRARNNVAVRKSRQKSKLKQRETEARVSELTSENEQLHKKVDLLTKELTVLKGLFVNVGAPLPSDFSSLLDS